MCAYGRHQMDKLNTILQGSKYNDTVNSKNKDLFTDTVNSDDNTLLKKISVFIQEQSIEPEGIALLISEMLGDKKSLSYYLLLVKEHNPSILLELAYQVKERNELGLINKGMPVYFIGILRKKGFKTRFRERKEKK